MDLDNFMVPARAKTSDLEEELIDGASFQDPCSLAVGAGISAPSVLTHSSILVSSL